MKEVVKVSISGIAFSFDADAYKVMKDYLDKLEAGYAKKPDGREIIADIEARIAELILNEQESDSVVGRGLAESVIAQLGFPDDLETDEEPAAEKLPKRLYRNPDGAVLGGVCSGLGAYFNIDPVWIRLAFFLPVLLAILPIYDTSGFFGSLFGMFVILYVILWIAIPMARTPRQKLEMRGEKVTASSIHQTFADDASAMPPSPKRQRSASVWADIVYGIGRILLFLLKAVVFLIVLVAGIAAISCLVAILAVLFGAEIIGGQVFADSFSGLEGITPGLYAVLAILAVLIPLIVLGYFLLKVLFSSKINRTFMIIASVVWIMLVVYLSVVTLHNADNLREGSRRFEYEIEHYDDTYGRRWLQLFRSDWDDWTDDWDDWDDWKEEERGHRDGYDIDDLYREYREDDWDDDNVHVEITEHGGKVTIRKIVVSPDNPADTLSDERIVTGRHRGRHCCRSND